MAGKRIIVFCLFTLVALCLAAFASSGTQAQGYKVLHDYALTDSTAADANSDSDNSMGMYVPDYNYEDSSMFTLTPIDMSSEMGYNIPIGAKVGVLDSESTVGIANGACAGPLPVVFEMHNASTDTTDTLDAAATYWLLKDKFGEPIPYTDLPEPPYDDDLPDYLEAYPEFLNTMFDPDGPGGQPPLIPKARYAGHDWVSNMNILVQIVVFHPGQLSLLPGINAQFGAEVGNPSVVVLNNPVTAVEAPGAISDFCTPLWTTTTLYTPTQASDYGVGGAGTVMQQNPSAGAGVMGTGTIISRNYSRSERDADGDGIENDLDPCHYSPGWVNDGCPIVNVTAEASYECANGLDDDGDTKVNDGCPQVGPDADCDITDNSGTGPPDGDCNDPGEATLCDNALDDDGDPVTDASWDPRVDGGPGTGDEDGDGIPDSCDPGPNSPDTDEDDDGYLNNQDICPLVADGEATTNQADNDATLLNADLGPGPDSIGDACDDSDGDGNEDGAGAGTCTDGVDNGIDGVADELDPDCDSAWDASDGTPWGSNPGTGLFYHSMPWSAVCIGGDDDDGDGYCNDLETALGSPTDNGSEYNLTVAGVCDDDEEDDTYDNCCDNALDDDSDGYYNDGCPAVGTHFERGDDCADSDSDDTGGPGPDIDEETLTSGNMAVNDGCPVIGVPESLVIDVQIVAGDAQPRNAVPQSCSDEVDNDGDTTTDTDNQTLGCAIGHTSYASDSDYDSYDDGVDNCPTVWNPEQKNTDYSYSAGPPEVIVGPKGDACDADDDNDGWNDDEEWKCGSDPLDAASTCEVCDGLDNDGDGSVDEGFVDDNGDGEADCVEDDYNAGECAAPHADCDVDGDTVANGPDPDCDGDFTTNGHYNDAVEEYLGTDPCVKCGQYNDPFDTAVPYGTAIDVSDFFTFVSTMVTGASIADDSAMALGDYLHRLDFVAPFGTVDVSDFFQYVSKMVVGYGMVCGTDY